MKNSLPAFLYTPEVLAPIRKTGKQRQLPFVDHTLKTIASFIKSGYVQSETARGRGLLQRLDARIKLVFVLSYILLINSSSNIITQFSVAFFLVFLYVFSGINVIEVFKKITLLGIMFGLVIIAPAALNLVTPGKNILVLLHFDTTHQFWIYHVPATIGITREGCMVVLRFFLKVSNAIALSLLLVYTTPFHEIIRSLKLVRVPDMFLMIITLSYKFIFILAQTTEETYLALKSRWWKHAADQNSGNLITGRISHIFRKSWMKYEEIYKAMIARGFTGKVTVLTVIKITRADILFTVCFVLWGVISCII